jgi:hypothetical protein
MSGDFVKGLPKVTLFVDGEPKFHMLPQQVTKENIYWVFCRSNPVLTPVGTSEKLVSNATGEFLNLTPGTVYLVEGGACRFFFLFLCLFSAEWRI